MTNSFIYHANCAVCIYSSTKLQMVRICASKEGSKDKNNGIKIKLCRAAGATKTQIHSKANIQCIIVMCLVVCYVFVLYSGGSYGKVRHVGKCLVTSDVS